MNFLISAGPTREFLDPVRYLSNPSSGRMGIALVRAAARLGHEVFLVHGPCAVGIPRGKRIHARAVTTCLQMRREILKLFPRADVVLMAAAVTDFRPRYPKARKIRKESIEGHSLDLVKNPDILMELGRRKSHQFLVGFSAETHNLPRHALIKMRKKNLDIIVANRVGGASSAFGSATNQVIIFGRDGSGLSLPRMSKEKLAGKLVRMVLQKARRAGL